MSKRYGTFPTRIRYRGIFDFAGLYKLMHDWLTERQFDFTETKYKHKLDDAGRAEIEIYWDCWRRLDDYIKYWIYVKFHFWDFKEVEVIREGKKKKLVEGRMHISLWSEVEMDYQNNWRTKFRRMLLDFYHKYVVVKDIEVHHTDSNYYRTLKLNDEIKKFLDMESKKDMYSDFV